MADGFGFGPWFALHLVVACAGTWLARRYALRRDLLDHPGERRSHAVATPRGGGIGIVLAWLLALACMPLAFAASAMFAVMASAGLLLVAGVGWIDDHRPLSPWLRLGVHAIAATLLAWGIWQMTGDLAGTLLAFVSVLVLVNVWNFMDGIDGLAASQAAIAAVGYALVAGDPMIAALAWALVAACCGFLPFNFPKARIFLGDVGSGALGYALALLLALIATRKGGEMVVWPILVLPLSAFLIDASLTLSGRMVRGQRWWSAHVEHAYQQLAFRLEAHWPVTLVYAGWSACGILILRTATDRGTAINLCIAVGWCLAGGLAWKAALVRASQHKQQEPR